MDILGATADFERWLGQQLEVVRPDLALKHANMAKAPFPFFRATFYRWVQRWPDICGDLANAPSVLAVGDLHIENFGTWRDAEGSLIWGVNDLDEVYPSAYSLDLVRLTASAYLAMEEGHLAITRKEASDALERGYREAIEAGGRPFALAEHHRWLRLLAFGKLRDPARFWKKIKELPQHLTKSSVKVRAMLEAALPQPGMKYELKKRIAGLGSLGHMRVLALANWQGAYVVREAKALRPSAWVWARRRPTNTLYCGALASRAVRVADPHVHFRDGWLVRRLAPDCSRIELASLPKERDEARLLYSMGWEAANLHLGSPSAVAKIRKDLAKRSAPWLHKAAKAMSEATLADWEQWRRGWKRAKTR